MYPAYTPAKELLAAARMGSFFPTGRAIPKDNPEIVAIIRELAESGTPIFGWGLGHQLMAVAAGGPLSSCRWGTGAAISRCAMNIPDA